MKRETNWVQKIRNSIILLIIGFLIGLTFSCGEKEDSDNGTVVKDISWQGAYSSIPEALRKNNPIASNDAKKGGTLRIYSHQFPKSLNYYLEQFSTTAEIFQTMRNNFV